MNAFSYDTMLSRDSNQTPFRRRVDELLSRVLVVGKIWVVENELQIDLTLIVPYLPEFYNKVQEKAAIKTLVCKTNHFQRIFKYRILH